MSEFSGGTEENQENLQDGQCPAKIQIMHIPKYQSRVCIMLIVVIMTSYISTSVDIWNTE
jgi:hypothetical protein